MIKKLSNLIIHTNEVSLWIKSHYNIIIIIIIIITAIVLLRCIAYSLTAVIFVVSLFL